MIRKINILEVPLLLLIIAFECIQEGSNIVAAFLIIVSVGRLWANVVADEFLYKK